MKTKGGYGMSSINRLEEDVEKREKEEAHHIKEHGRTCFRLEEQAPDFRAPAFYRGQEVEVSLESFRSCWLLIFFYSSDFTFV
jgi:peroxiredoxin (alkyl hydroperoxide reductase subunit C)